MKIFKRSISMFKKKHKPLSEMSFDEFQAYLADLFKRVEDLLAVPLPPMEELNPGFLAGIDSGVEYIASDEVKELTTQYKKRFGQ
jgi:hypothetical protein